MRGCFDSSLCLHLCLSLCLYLSVSLSLLSPLSPLSPLPLSLTSLSSLSTLPSLSRCLCCRRFLCLVLSSFSLFCVVADGCCCCRRCSWVLRVLERLVLVSWQMFATSVDFLHPQMLGMRARQRRPFRAPPAMASSGARVFLGLVRPVLKHRSKSHDNRLSSREWFAQDHQCWGIISMFSSFPFPVHHFTSSRFISIRKALVFLSFFISLIFIIIISNFHAFFHYHHHH